MSIGERIQDLRKKKQLSQFQLAQLLEVSRQAVSKWENDQASPDTLNLIRLADILDTNIEYLAAGKAPVKEPEPIVIKIAQKVDKVKVVEQVVEKPVIKRIVRVKYTRNPIEFGLTALAGLAVGVLIGALLL